MREILFRGKRVDSGEWVYGNLNYGTIEIESIKDSYFISDFNVTPWDKKFYPVISETVGQSTGLTDKNGKKIFEDDIIRVKYSIRCPIGVGNSFRIGTYDIDYIASVIFDDCRFCLAKANGEIYEIPLSSENTEVIGNIHDNPELLEEKE